MLFHLLALLLLAPLTSAEILNHAQPTNWRPTDPHHTLYLETPAGRVVIELAAEFAPKHVQNIVKLVQQHFFDGLAVVRVQENYVVQWGDPDAETPQKRSLGDAQTHLPAEMTRTTQHLDMAKLQDGDVYAPEVGWLRGMPMARDPQRKMAWLAHCYGMVGAGRDNPADSSNGAELYAIIGQAPRHLDRNMTLVGRAIWGMETLTALPRGTAAMGFYAKPEQRTRILQVRLEADVPEKERTALQVLRTDTPLFQEWLESRRNRREPFFVQPAGKVDLCTVQVPVRLAQLP